MKADLNMQAEAARYNDAKCDEAGGLEPFMEDVLGLDFKGAMYLAEQRGIRALLATKLAQGNAEAAAVLAVLKAGGADVVSLSRADRAAMGLAQISFLDGLAIGVEIAEMKARLEASA